MNRAKLDLLRFVPLGAPVWVASLTSIAAGKPTPAPDGVSILSAQNRLLRQFDFEEAEQDPPGVRVIDLMLRALHGWRAGLERMVITAPWTGPGERRGQIMPDPSFGVWRVLAEQLDGRAFVTELPMADSMRC